MPLEKALKRLNRELTQYQGDSDFASNQTNRNRHSMIKEGCKCTSCSYMRYKQFDSFIRSQIKNITHYDKKPNLSKNEHLVSTPDKLFFITDNSLFLLGSSWLRFLRAMPQKTLDDLLLTKHLKVLEKLLSIRQLTNPNISLNTNIFLKDNVSMDEVQTYVEIKFKERYKNQVNDYYKERRNVQIGMIVGIVLVTASSIILAIILAMYGFPAIALAHDSLVIGWCFLFSSGLALSGSSVMMGFESRTTSIDWFTSKLKENHDKLTEALKEEFPTENTSFFKSASQLTAQIDNPRDEITKSLVRPGEIEMVCLKYPPLSRPRS